MKALVTNKKVVDLIHLHFIVVLLGFTGALGKLISLNAIDMVWYRMLFSALFMIIWLKLRKRLTIPPRNEVFKLLLTGAIVACHWVAFFGSIKSSTVSVALVCLASTTLFASLLEPLFENAKVSVFEVSLGFVVIGALAIIFRFERVYSTGIILGLLSAFLGALFMVLNKLLQKRHEASLITNYEMIGGVMILSLVLCFTNPGEQFIHVPEIGDFMWLLILAIVCTAYAFMASIKVMRSLSAFQVVLTINLEPIYGIILAYLIFGDSELMSFPFYIATFVIIAAVFSYSIIKKRKLRIRTKN